MLHRTSYNSYTQVRNLRRWYGHCTVRIIDVYSHDPAQQSYRFVRGNG